MRVIVLVGPSAGQVVDMVHPQARDMLRRGYARLAEPVEAEIETASIEPQVEQAVKRKRGRPRKVQPSGGATRNGSGI